jgi:hypothetical protein
MVDVDAARAMIGRLANLCGAVEVLGISGRFPSIRSGTGIACFLTRWMKSLRFAQRWIG